MGFEGQRYKGERIQRKCLKCDKTFTGRGRFERICRDCKQKVEWKEGVPSATLNLPSNEV